MNRNEFIKKCGVGCVGLLAGATILGSCSGIKYVTAPINGSFMEVPIDAFQIEKDGITSYRNVVIMENDQLQYPIAVFRIDEQQYRGFFMRCTHQGTELQVFGDRFQCPAHGSEFTNEGVVQNGPADKNLRSFPITLSGETLKINLA